MALAAQLYRSLPGERRTAERHPADIGATLRGSDGAPLDVQVHDLSTTGFRLETAEALSIGSIFWIGFTGAQINAASPLRLGADGYGCRFLIPITPAQLRA